MPTATNTDDQPAPGFFFRFFVLAWIAYFRTLFDADFAAGVARLREGRPALPPPPEPEKKVEPEKKKPEPEKPVLREATPDAALQLLALLQREGRFVDFLEEDVASFSDAQVGAAARVVHEGCRKALREHVPLEPVRSEDEGAKLTLDKGFDAKAIRLTGNVVGEPPFKGTLAHRGWRAKDVKLPKMAEGHDARVIAPAEVEL
ncbi:DUF2760 domain-containing protein [Sandaracinus amylolyticus]|uniref:DUF2760 domain-containing protein n=1 Tax=Sandaracinus amylolyticus TaxID=927083 RepID=A0A0F6SHV2_9BACT|nr:DUF2760 domain-containing protein [Sandaracinus amylolyticus]AKF11089.1 Hypothetical protein DB32_008238 [Sandaracinus amylolyticus]